MKKKKIKRFNEGGVTSGGSDSDLLEKARSLTEQRDGFKEWRPDGTGRTPVMDVSKVKDDVRAFPRWGHIDKNFVGGGARLSAVKKLDKDTMIEAYADANLMRDKYQGTKGNISGYGVNLVKNFAGGGKVSSASSRGDGAAKRGKTRGRIV